MIPVSCAGYDATAFFRVAIRSRIPFPIPIATLAGCVASQLAYDVRFCYGLRRNAPCPRRDSHMFSGSCTGCDAGGDVMMMA